MLPWQRDGDGELMYARRWRPGAAGSPGRALHPEPDASGQNGLAEARSGILKSRPDEPIGEREAGGSPGGAGVVLLGKRGLAQPSDKCG